VLRKRYPQHIPEHYEDLSGYDWPRVTPETTELCLRLSADPAFAGRLAPIPHMASALCALSESGYAVHVITARPQCVRHATHRWLVRQGVAGYVDQIHCVERPLDKVDLARALACAAFVEDNHATAEALGSAGVRSYLLDAPYNRLPASYSVRVHDWQELLALLLAADLPQFATLSLSQAAESLGALAS
jgi:5'(3')-deoxyribonucleotidase